MSGIALSIVVAAQGSEDDVLECLASLGALDADVEVIVVATRPMPRVEENTALRIVAARSESLPRLLGLGVSSARGSHVALAESCFRFDHGWLDEAKRAIQERPREVIGGCVNPDESLGLFDRAGYFCDYVQFSSPWVDGEVSELPGSNVIFPSDVLPGGNELETRGLWKTLLCERLVAERRATLSGWPTMRVSDARHLSVGGWVARRWRHGRCWGAMNVASWSAGRRFAHAVGIPIVAWIVGWRIVRRMRAAGVSAGVLLAHMPAIAIAVKWWMAGEWTGNLFGPGRACEKL